MDYLLCKGTGIIINLIIIIKMEGDRFLYVECGCIYEHH